MADALTDSPHIGQFFVGFFRFTGDSRFLGIPVVVAPPNQANQVRLTIVTGGDDLRGGNDNLNVAVRYRDGRTQSFPFVNAGARWADNSTHVVLLNLDHAVNPNDITGLDLQTTFSGGFGGDNWNMNSLVALAVGASVNQPIFSAGFKRFTGDDKTLALRR